ncbi:MAG: hypothetical protein O9327_05910 [Polaromonas sp.]|nr:hypothetical protein [Polaromonas sp.]
MATPQPIAIKDQVDEIKKAMVQLSKTSSQLRFGDLRNARPIADQIYALSDRIEAAQKALGAHGGLLPESLTEFERALSNAETEVKNLLTFIDLRTTLNEGQQTGGAKPKVIKQ